MTSETKHTPGPWNYSGPCEMTGRYSIYHNGPLAYCADTTVTPGDGEANARLIATAPDLLVALRELVADNMGHPKGVTVPQLDKARAAIAKATGEG